MFETVKSLLYTDTLFVEVSRQLKRHTVIFKSLRFRAKMGFKCVHHTKVKLESMQETGAEGVKVRWLIKKDDGAPNFAMRLFELEPKGCSPLHSHSWEHEVYVLEGNCQVTCDREKCNASAGYVVFVPPNARHQFVNVGESKLKFLCLVPHH
jgi:quercetin dioxygenase-like cupin family protein